jgi:hypothetical protein
VGRGVQSQHPKRINVLRYSDDSFLLFFLSFFSGESPQNLLILGRNKIIEYTLKKCISYHQCHVAGHPWTGHRAVRSVQRWPPAGHRSLENPLRSNPTFYTFLPTVERVESGSGRPCQEITLLINSNVKPPNTPKGGQHQGSR